MAVVEEGVGFLALDSHLKSCCENKCEGVSYSYFWWGPGEKRDREMMMMYDDA